MELTREEQSILGGERGDAARRALEFQIEVGKFWGAKRFVPVTNVHMMGDIEVMGDGGLAYLNREAASGARCVVGTTTNARCFDFAHCDRLGQDAGEAKKEKELIATLRRMDVVTTDTCINYQTVYQPHLGEHVAWGDTGTVIYANSVFGARSNFESGPAALAAALTGRTPEYGFHLAEHRQGTFTVELKAALDDLAVELGVGEDLRVRPEPDDRPGVVGLPHHLDRALRHAALELHVVHLPAAVDPDLELLAQEVDCRHAHAMQAGGHLVAAAAELSAGVEAGQDQFEGGHSFFLVDVDRDAPAVVLDLDAAVGVQGDRDLGGVTGQGLVYRVVHDLVDQVVETGRGGRADVHARTPPHMLPALEDLDLLGGVGDVSA